MATLAKECEEMILKLEWSNNRMNGKGSRCPYCDGLQSEGQSPVVGSTSHDCGLGKLCMRIRAVDEAECMMREAGRR